MIWNGGELPECLIGGYIDYLVDCDVWDGLPEEARLVIIQGEVKRANEELGMYKEKTQFTLQKIVELSKEIARIKQRINSK